jgi:hypothetical protein
MDDATEMLSPAWLPSTDGTLCVPADARLLPSAAAATLPGPPVLAWERALFGCRPPVPVVVAEWRECAGGLLISACSEAAMDGGGLGLGAAAERLLVDERSEATDGGGVVVGAPPVGAVS